MLSAILVYAVVFWGIVRKKSKLVTLLLLSICFIMAWLSNDQYDYLSYSLAYTSPKSSMAQRFEVIYRILMRIGNLFGFDYSTFRALYSALAILIFFCALKYYTEYINIPIALGMLFPLIYLFPIQRFFMAAVIVFYSCRYLMDETKLGVVKYFIGVIIAGLLHSGCFFFLILPAYRVVKSKKNFFIITVGLVIPFVVLAEVGILNTIISFLPLGSSVIELMENGNRANIYGVIEETVVVLLVTIPGFLSFYHYISGNANNKTKKTNEFMEVVFYINVIAFFIIAFRVYAISAERMLYVVMLMNYTAAANVLSVYSTRIRNYSFSAFAVMIESIGCAIALLILELFYCTPQLRELIFWMHFNTNPVFVKLNFLMGG